MSTILRAFGCCLALGTPASSYAQRQTVAPKESRALMHRYANCVVRMRSGKASEALLANADSMVILRRYPMLMVPDCLSLGGASVSMSFGGDLYRYALADALVNRELATLDVPDLTSRPRLEHLQPGEKPAPVLAGEKKVLEAYNASSKAYDNRVLASFLSSYGECIVRTNPQASKALLLSKPESSAEMQQFRNLQPAFADCLVDGRTFRFGKVPLRGSVAINYYRLVRSAVGSSTKAGR